MGDPRLTLEWPRRYDVETTTTRDWLERKLRSGVLKPNDMLVFIDAYDVLYNGGKRDILAGWRRAGSPDILFSAERFCWPDADLAARFASVSESPYKYLNSGTFMGTDGALAAALRDPTFEDLLVLQVHRVSLRASKRRPKRLPVCYLLFLLMARSMYWRRRPH